MSQTRIGWSAFNMTQMFETQAVTLSPRNNELINLCSGMISLFSVWDLSIIPQRTALTGFASFLDVFFLCPRIPRSQDVSVLHGGELPPTAAMTTGDVSRVQNPGTVNFLQLQSKTGYLTTMSVAEIAAPESVFGQLGRALHPPNTSFLANILYLTGIAITLLSFSVAVMIRDWWCFAVLSLLAAGRLCHVSTIRRRAEAGWKGVPEPDVKGDLFVLLSHDRWVRMQGPVTALKAVTSGQWLREMTFVEQVITVSATISFYSTVAVVAYASQIGKIVIGFLFFSSTALLSTSNALISELHMHVHIVRIEGLPKAYAGRLDLARALIEDTGRDDWAIRLGLIIPPKGHEIKASLL